MHPLAMEKQGKRVFGNRRAWNSDLGTKIIILQLSCVGNRTTLYTQMPTRDDSRVDGNGRGAGTLGR